MGQSINQIDIDRLEARFAAQVEYRSGHLIRLNAMDRFLYDQVEILNAHGYPVESQAPEHLDLGFRSCARVHLDADFRVLCEGKAVPDVVKEVLHLGGTEIGWRAAAPMQLHHGPGMIESQCNRVDFPTELLEIRVQHFVVFVDHDIAAAEKAKALAEREVNINRDRRRRLSGIGFDKSPLKIVRAESIDPLGSGGVAGVPRPRHVVSVQDRLGNIESCGLDINIK